MSARRLELDYLVRPRRIAWAGIAVLAVALALGSHVLMRYRDARQEALRLDTRAALLSAARRPVHEASRERLETETKAAEAVLRELRVPWAKLLMALEEASIPGVALLQLQPDASQLRLTAEAQDREAMFSYLKRLEAVPSLAEVHLVSHEIRDEGRQRSVQFSAQAVLK